MPGRHDIQGNILRGYARHLHAAYLLTSITEPAAARRLIGRLLAEDRIATERNWDRRPATRVNVAITRSGLERLGVDLSPFAPFSDFREGMSARARECLGDLGDNDPSRWPATLPEEIDLLFTVYGREPRDREDATQELTALLAGGGCTVLRDQRADLLSDGREHFGFRDGFSQPALPGVSKDRRSRRGEGVRQRGLPLAGETWREVRLGEFVLGHEDEDGIVPGAGQPMLRNGTFMVWRKLEQDVDAFTEWVRARAGDDPRVQDALRAQVLGRWPNGDSLIRRPVWASYADAAGTGGAGTEDAREHDRQINNFTYGDDPDGLRCPLGAHVRRANPRDALGFRTERSRRNRIIRRGMPYVDGDGTRGLVFVCFNASIARQFEQVQGNWLMGGDTFGLGAERDFLTAGVDSGRPSERMTIQGDRARPPEFLHRDRQFVTVRGGYYLFVPGMAALGLIAGV